MKIVCSSNYKYIVPFSIITFSLIFTSGLIYGSKGPVILLLLIAIIVTIKLSGIRFMNEKFDIMNPWGITRYGPFVIVHSHHIKKLRENGKEFKFKGKYFCTGCYGMCFGTCISIIIFIIYLLYDFNSILIVPLIYLIIILMIPIILRYWIFIRMKSSLRFLSNAFLPLGLVLLLCLIDNVFQNWIINGFYGLLLFGIAFLRGKIASIDDKRLLKRIDN